MGLFKNDSYLKKNDSYLKKMIRIVQKKKKRRKNS